MSSFFVDLWESIFTPGPTPTILKATNASFAALQIVLAALLFATFSIHFVVLSILCAGLWWSINWFAAELAIAQEAQSKQKNQDDLAAANATTPRAASDDSDTEVEGHDVSDSVKHMADVEPVERRGQLKQRGAMAVPPAPPTQSSVSTEDEWEKVSESEQDKEK